MQSGQSPWLNSMPARPVRNASSGTQSESSRARRQPEQRTISERLASSPAAGSSCRVRRAAPLLILAGNPAACELLDYTLPDLLQRGPTDISPLRQDEVDQVFGVLRERGQLMGTVWLRQRDGTELAMEFRAWLVVVAGAAAWFAWFRPAVGHIPAEPLVLTEPRCASLHFL
jgi:PAS domain-containing protein